MTVPDDFMTHVNCTCADCQGCPCSWAQLTIGHACQLATGLLQKAAVEAALRVVFEHADYDLFKGLEGDETGVDEFPDLTLRFLTEYGNWPHA